MLGDLEDTRLSSPFFSGPQALLVCTRAHVCMYEFNANEWVLLPHSPRPTEMASRDGVQAYALFTKYLHDSNLQQSLRIIEHHCPVAPEVIFLAVIIIQKLLTSFLPSSYSHAFLTLVLSDYL